MAEGRPLGELVALLCFGLMVYAAVWVCRYVLDLALGIVFALKVVFLVGCAVLHLGGMAIVSWKLALLYMPFVVVRRTASACGCAASAGSSRCPSWRSCAMRWCRCTASFPTWPSLLCAALVALPRKLAAFLWAPGAGSWLAVHMPARLTFHVELSRSCVVASGYLFAVMLTGTCCSVCLAAGAVLAWSAALSSSPCWRAGGGTRGCSMSAT